MSTRARLRRSRLAAPAALVAVLTVLLAACSPAGRDAIQLTATFDDVIDLVENAHVRAGDIPIGVVESIELTPDLVARVTLSVRPDTGLPSEVEARLLQTSILGERFIELRAKEGATGELADGAVIDDTVVVGDFEDLVVTGSDLLGAVSADQLALAVQTGATAFGGRGGLLGRFLDDVNAFVGGYEEGKEDIVRVIESFDAFVSELAPAAETNAAALADLARASQALEEEDDRLLDALEDVRRLSVVGSRILDDHEAQLDNVFRRLHLLLDQILRIDGALQNMLTWIARHNLHVPNGAIDELAQIWQDFVICGFNDEPGDESAACDPPNPGQPNSPPPFVDEDDPCNDDHSKCPDHVGEGPR